MKPISYNKTARVKKAKLVRSFGKTSTNLIIIISLLLILVGVVSFYTPYRPFFAITGFSLVGLMFAIWIKWDLSKLPAIYNPDSAQISINEVVTSDIVYLVNDKQSPRDVLSAISGNWQSKFILLRYQIPFQTLLGSLSAEQAASTELWNRAFKIAGQVPIREVSAGVLIVAMIVENPIMKQWLSQNGMDEQDIIGGLMWEESLWQHIIRPNDNSDYGGIGRDWTSGFTPFLDHFGLNISLSIAENNLDFSNISRGHVLEAMIMDLSKSDRGNLALVGEVGVGKTSLVYSLAEKLIKGESSNDEINYKKIVQIDAAAVSAAAGQQMSLESIFEQIIDNAVRAGDVILYLDEAQLFFGSGPGEINLSSILLPALQNRGLRAIVSFNYEEWQKLSSSAPSVATLFSKVEVQPADKEQTLSILQDISIQLESKSNAIVTFKAIQASYDMAERYLRSKAMPARAIDLLSDSMNYAEGGLVTVNSVAKATEILTNSKVSETTAEEKTQLLNLEDMIHQRMINQTRAVKVVSDALRRSRAGVRNTNRPVGSFLFLGPTGVGKTELTKSLAAVYFGSEESMNRLDMTEYQNRSDVKRLLEPASSENAGSTFLQKINQNPFSVVLLDEIEKAHPDILNLLLQMLDEGVLTDTAGHKVSFKESIIICTSNAGAGEIRDKIMQGQKLEDFEEEFTNHLIDQNVFKPELINRFDEIVLFRPLTKDELLQVAKIIIKQVNTELEDRKISVQLTDESLAKLVEQGYDPRLGARPMRRIITRTVENLIAKKLLSGEIQQGATVTLDVNDLQDVA